ncbi:PilZ domain-containing protein [Glaciecola sp. MH2013]|uniref:PilZ domain-containing protein n=1 Tax=Glaciecola sp. MH2013 TaxID=2785524 RepID=UPI00189F20C6|nr:PilZ domain-containing protein [Glaciecola sp. MH2013]MBF7072934.1 PilZ domain-containing protein [Glaciecola sp. MH2013]
MLGYDDKRNFYRMMINSPCELTLLDDPTQRKTAAICKDISATGMSLEIEEASMEIGTLLEVAIESNNDQIPSLNAKAKVLRCEPEGDNACLVGVEISEMK